MHRFPIVAYRKDALDRMSNPESAGQPEALPWRFFDTQTYTDNTTTTATYFTTVQGNPADGNMLSQGQLPDPQYFQMFGVMYDVLANVQAIAAATAPGAVDDVLQLMSTSRSLAVLSISSKEYIRCPLRLLHASGGINGYGYGTLTAQARIEWAQWGPADGGLFVGGSIIIPPKQAFSLVVTWRAAVNLVGDQVTVATLDGVLFRRVQ